MADLKTKPTGEEVEHFLDAIPDEKKRRDCFALLDLMQQVSGLEPRIWASSMVGFGEYHYKYASGHEGDAAIVGFAPRKANLVLYVLSGFDGQEQLLVKLGKHTAGKGCLYIKRLDDIDLPTLRLLVQQTVEHIQQRYPRRMSK